MFALPFLQQGSAGRNTAGLILLIKIDGTPALHYDRFLLVILNVRRNRKVSEHQKICEFASLKFPKSKSITGSTGEKAEPSQLTTVFFSLVRQSITTYYCNQQIRSNIITSRRKFRRGRQKAPLCSSVVLADHRWKGIAPREIGIQQCGGLRAADREKEGRRCRGMEREQVRLSQQGGEGWTSRTSLS